MQGTKILFIFKSLSFVILIIIISACKKSELASSLKVGSIDAQVNFIEDTLREYTCDSGTPYSLDCDGDGEADFKFINYCCSGPAQYYQNTKLECLHSKAMILDNNSDLIPDILNAGDLLDENQYWKKTKSELVNISFTSTVIGGSGEVYITGPWHDVSYKFIGYKIEKEDHQYYGWIKISVPNLSYVYIVVHEIGKIKAAL